MALLEIKDLCYSYEDGDNRKVIYNGASADFEPERFYAVTGESGSGKTTLLYIIAGLEKGYEGEILFKGKSCIKGPGCLVVAAVAVMLASADKQGTSGSLSVYNINGKIFKIVHPELLYTSGRTLRSSYLDLISRSLSCVSRSLYFTACSKSSFAAASCIFAVTSLISRAICAGSSSSSRLS